MIKSNSPNDGAAAAEDHNNLLRIVGKITAGDYSAIDELVSLTGMSKEETAAKGLAEALGLIMVRLEAREFHLANAEESEARLADLNELKDRHLAIAAHDLVNPISSIRGLSQMMIERDIDPDTTRKFLESIFRVSNQMLTLVDDLLDTALIDSGKFELAFETANYSKLTEERGAVVSPMAAKKGISVEVGAEPTPDLEFDVARMRQALDNLLSNAVKYSESGTTISIACKNHGASVQITVSDQGPGIAEGDLKDLFVAFQTSGNQPTGSERSTGLGLSITKKIVDAHGGTLSVTSKVGKGSTFSILMPNRD